MNLVLHTHWDREWYVSLETYRYRLLKVLHELADRVGEGGDLPAFTLDGQTCLLEDAQVVSPQVMERLLPLLKSGRLHCGPWYSMPDTVLVSAEGLIRNLKWGIEQARQWGSNQFCGYLPDSFGHSGAIPTLLRHLGMETAMIWRGRQPAGQSSWFHWAAVDGSQVLTYQLPLGYFHTVLHPQEDDAVPVSTEWANLSQQLSRFETLPQTGHLHPLGGDHLGPPDPELWAELQALLPEAEVLHPHQFLQKGLDASPEALTQVPVETGALRAGGGGAPYLLSGTLSARLAIKQRHTQLERRLTYQTEPWLTLAHSLNTQPIHPEEAGMIRQAWQGILLNQAHDSICGCSSDAVHQAGWTRYQATADLCDSLETDALTRLSVALPEGTLHLRASNAPQLPSGRLGRVLPWQWRGPQTQAERLRSLPAIQVEKVSLQLKEEWRTDPRRVPLSHRVEAVANGVAWVPASTLSRDSAWPSVSTLPAYWDHEGLPRNVAVQVDRDTRTLSNRFITVVIDAQTGCLSVTDRGSGETFRQLNQGWMLVDKGDSYNRAPVPAVPAEPWTLANIKWLSQGPLCAEAELSLRFSTRPHPTDWIRCRVRLLAESARVEFHWQWTPPLPSRLIQVGFYQPNPIASLLVSDLLGDVTRSHPVWPDRYQGLPVDSPAEEWLPNGDVHQGLLQTPAGTLLADGLPDYEIVDGHWLCLTLHRGFEAISGGKLPSRGCPAGPPVATPQGQGIGQLQTARYCWLHPGLSLSERLAEQAAFLQLERLEDKARAHPVATRRVTVTPDLPPVPAGVVVQSFRWGTPQGLDEPGWLIRLNNRLNEPVHWALPAHSLNGLDELEAGAGARTSLVIPPHGLLAVYCSPKALNPSGG